MIWHLAAAALLGVNFGYCLNGWVNRAELRGQTLLWGAWMLLCVLWPR